MGKYKDRQQFKSKFQAKQWVGVVLITLGIVGFILSCITNFVIGKFLLGAFGILSYPIFLSCILFGVAMVMNLVFKGDRKLAAYIISLLGLLVCLLHSIFSANALNTLSFGEYLSTCYSMQNGVTVGGVIIGLICNIVSVTLGGVGTCIFFGIVLVVVGGFAVDYIIYSKNQTELTTKNQIRLDENEEESSSRFEAIPEEEFMSTKLNESEEIEETQNEEDEQENAKTLLFGLRNENDFSAKEPESRQKSAKEILFGEKAVPNIYNSTDEERRAWLEANPATTSKTQSTENVFGSRFSNSRFNDVDDEEEQNARMSASQRLFGNRTQEKEEETIDKSKAMDILGLGRQNEQQNANQARRGISSFGDDLFDDEKPEEQNTRARSISNFNTDLTINENEPRQSEQNIISRQRSERTARPRAEQTEIGQVAKPTTPIKQVVKDIKYNPPPVTLLKENKEDTSKYVKNYEENARIIEEKLETFKIPVKVVGVVRGPTVTRYELTMPSGIPVKKILNYDSDLAMALRSKAGVRIEAPIPGKNAVGIEVPNDPRSMVSFRELVESKEFASSTAVLPVAIGKNISGEVVVKSLAKMVHLLVAGSTGSGKSVFLHSLIMSLMFKMSPEQLRFIMIDPKRVEFSRYKGMPHMMLSDVVSDAEKAVNSLSWAVKEMERRYKLLEEYKCQKLEIFNQCEAVKNGEQKKLPYIVIVVDELAELMGVAKREVEERIRRISQLGRASGIHLVLATQRPSVEVVTGTIKTNLPSRIAFALASFIDSKTILDEPGAEKLLGQGDMLFAPQESNTPTRLQGAYISDEEIERCIDYIKNNNECNYDLEVEKEIYASKEEQNQASGQTNEDHSDQMDELLPQALKFFIESGKGSITMVQRRFYVGYSRAARIVDQMELRGYISPAEGSKNRDILITMDQFKEIFGDV